MTDDREAKIDGTAENWEGGLLGLDDQFVERAPPMDAAEVDDALELKMISIRLEKSLIADFKAIGHVNGLGYQPLMRQVLARFVEGEKRRYQNAAAAEYARQVGEDPAVDEVAGPEVTAEPDRDLPGEGREIHVA